MASAYPHSQPPADLQRRFAAGENPHFELIQQCGSLQLWRSCTGRGLQFHVADGTVVYGEMNRVSRAIEFFDALAQRDLRAA
jgi:hypothetical protein